MALRIRWWEEESSGYFKGVYAQAVSDKDTLVFVDVRSCKPWECRVGLKRMGVWLLQVVNTDRTPLTNEQQQAFLQLAKARYPL